MFDTLRYDVLLGQVKNTILTERKVPKFIGNMKVFSFMEILARSAKSIKLLLNFCDLGIQSTL